MAVLRFIQFWLMQDINFVTAFLWKYETVEKWEMVTPLEFNRFGKHEKKYFPLYSTERDP